MDAAEATIQMAVAWLRLVIESVGAATVAVGFTMALVTFVRSSNLDTQTRFIRVRLTLARFLALALEFQLGADILSTAVAPTWDRIGRLAAIAVIRTALNYFLSLEMREEQRRMQEAAQSATAH